MLIKVKRNNLTGVQKYKSEFWEKSGYTPNEAYQKLPLYKRIIDDFARYNRIPGPHKFFEVRVLKEETSALYSATIKWWTDKNIMDQIFWVFMKPVREVLDGHFYQYYCLEPNESFRVWEILGKPGNIDLSHAFIIPTECVDMAWNETVNGYSEHLHLREEKPKTQEQIDKEAALDAEARKLLADGWDVIPLGNEFDAPILVDQYGKKVS